MYNTKDIQFVGKHDFDKESADKFASWNVKTFSVGIFQWQLKSNKKEMKRGKCLVRVEGKPSDAQEVFNQAEKIVALLDGNKWVGKKKVTIS